MKYLLIPVFLLAGFARAELPVLGPFSVAQNFSVALAGEPDARPTTWGSAAFAQNALTFYPPPLYRVRVLRIYGDFIAWPKHGVMAKGTYCEVGWGLKSTLPDGSVRASYGYDNSFVWFQNVVLPGNPSPRLAFDVDVHIGGLLGLDNVLISQTFVAINTSGLEMQEEPTFVVVYQFEEI
jgi:hypothetical protein